MFTPPVGVKRRSRYRGPARPACPVEFEDYSIGVESWVYSTGACPVEFEDHFTGVEFLSRPPRLTCGVQSLLHRGEILGIFRWGEIFSIFHWGEAYSSGVCPIKYPAFRAGRKTYVEVECSILIMLNGADAYSTGGFIALITRFS